MTLTGLIGLYVRQNWRPYLLSALMKEAMPVATHAGIDALAERAARNREVLGLHYPSDSAAGKELALRSLAIVKAAPALNALIQAAKGEWTPPSPSPA